MGQDDVVGRLSIDVHELRAEEHGAVRALILDGLAEHWGSVDPTLNRDLDDLMGTYTGGTTLVASDGGQVVGTGTVVGRRGLALPRSFGCRCRRRSDEVVLVVDWLHS